MRSFWAARRSIPASCCEWLCGKPGQCLGTEYCQSYHFRVWFLIAISVSIRLAIFETGEETNVINVNDSIGYKPSTHNNSGQY